MGFREYSNTIHSPVPIIKNEPIWRFIGYCKHCQGSLYQRGPIRSIKPKQYKWEDADPECTHELEDPTEVLCNYKW